MADHDDLFKTIQDLVMLHSPSGAEEEIDRYLFARFQDMGLTPQRDSCGNIIVKIAGSGGGSSLAITAHKDEIGALVSAISDDGRVRVKKLGGSFPWVYGEGVVDLLGEHACVSGILSFGSRHISHASPQHAHKETAPVRWEDAWVETKRTAQDLAEAGVRIGSRMVIGRHRKAPFRLNEHIASYTLDNKASVAILIELARRVRNPVPEVYLVATAKEEIGAVGALYFTRHNLVDSLIALEVAPIAPEYSIKDTPSPVLVVEDPFCVYDDALNALISRVAQSRGVALQLAALNGFGSDASLAMKSGHVARAACLAFATDNTHGYELTRLAGLDACIDVLEAVCQSEWPSEGAPEKLKRGGVR